MTFISLKRLMVVACLAASAECMAQGYLKTEYYSASTMKNRESHERMGSESMARVTGMYTKTLSVKMNERKQMKMWALTVRGSYNWLDTKDMATKIHPDEILNASVNLTHIRPLSPKWSLMLSAGAGVYAAPDEIDFNSILVNGAFIFMRRVNSNLSYGIGGGLTNSYGIPIIIPMAMLKLDLKGRYELNVNMSSGMYVNGAMKFGDKFKLSLTAIEMDGISAVRKIDGESYIYSSMLMRSFLQPELRIGKKSKLFVSAGCSWYRSSSLTKRSLKDFFKNFSKNENRMRHKPSLYLNIGYSYGL